jgi:hypothetical protein
LAAFLNKKIISKCMSFADASPKKVRGGGSGRVAYIKYSFACRRPQYDRRGSGAEFSCKQTEGAGAIFPSFVDSMVTGLCGSIGSTFIFTKTLPQGISSSN